MRLTWKDGVSTPFAEGAATLAATGAFWSAAAIRYALMAPPESVRSHDIREVICQDGAA